MYVIFLAGDIQKSIRPYNRKIVDTNIGQARPVGL
jgi:phosphate starvation-inducible protein PhoH